MDYQRIGNALEQTGKDIQKVNNRLDKVLEKLVAFEDLDERKQQAIEHIQADAIGEALQVLKTVEKDQGKAESLKAEETQLREELEQLRQQAERVAQGEVDAAGTTDAHDDKVTELNTDAQGDSAA